MGVVDPPGIPVKTKRLSPQRKNARNGIGAQKKRKTEHASYAAAVINAPYLPVEATPYTQQLDLKRKDCKFDRVVQSRDQKIQKLQKAVTSDKINHIVTKLTLVAKVNIEKNNCQGSRISEQFECKIL